MKKSYYNYIFEHRGKNYVYNSLSGAFAETDNEFDLIMKKIDNNEFIEENKTYDQMKKSGIIVDDDFDEIECYKDFFIKSKRNECTCTFTIAPSFSCNFRCPYCYESKNNFVMSDENITKHINECKRFCYIRYKKNQKFNF